MKAIVLAKDTQISLWPESEEDERVLLDLVVALVVARERDKKSLIPVSPSRNDIVELNLRKLPWLDLKAV